MMARNIDLAVRFTDVDTLGFYLLRQDEQRWGDLAAHLNLTSAGLAEKCGRARYHDGVCGR